MRTLPPLLGLVLGLVFCALPLLAATSERRVAAPCELTTATVIASGKQTDTGGREFAVRVINHSAQTIALPRSPIFGWRVESLHKGSWRFTAEGGPVRRVNPKDEQDAHVAVIGNQPTGPLLEIPPNASEDFYTFLPEASKALRPGAPSSTLKLTLFWAASSALAQSNHAVPLCALVPQWVVKLQTFPPPK
jgi:hypothetical protein